MAEIQFHTLAEAGKPDPEGGLRITVVPHFPAIWAEALRNVLEHKQLQYKRVVHPRGDEQDLLYELTAQRSTPVLFWNAERPRNSWVEQVMLAEKLGAPGSPSVIPADLQDRILMFGLLNELAGEDGISWYARIIKTSAGNMIDFGKKYGLSDEELKVAAPKANEKLKALASQLESQKAKGSNYFFGTTVSALDICWASHSLICAGLPNHERYSHWSDSVKSFFNNTPPGIEVPPILVEHRNHMFADVMIKAHEI